MNDPDDPIAVKRAGTSPMSEAVLDEILGEDLLISVRLPESIVRDMADEAENWPDDEHPPGAATEVAIAKACQLALIERGAPEADHLEAVARIHDRLLGDPELMLALATCIRLGLNVVSNCCPECGYARSLCCCGDDHG